MTLDVAVVSYATGLEPLLLSGQWENSCRYVSGGKVATSQHTGLSEKDPLEAIRKMINALINGYSPTLSPIEKRSILTSRLQDPSKAVNTLAFIREHIYVIASALAVFVSTIGLILCPLLSPLFITSLALSVTGIVIGIDLSLGGCCIFKNHGANKQAETRRKLSLYLRNLDAINPDQLWQLRRAEGNKSAFLNCIAGIADEMVRKRLMTSYQCTECYNKLAMPLWSNCDVVLRYMVFLAALHASKEEADEDCLSLYNYLKGHQETKRIMAKVLITMLPEEIFKRWLAPLSFLQNIDANKSIRPQLEEFKVFFMNWLYEQNIGHLITSKEAYEYENSFDRLLVNILSKASLEDQEECPQKESPQTNGAETPIKKALIIISSGGGGHISIAEATKKALETDSRYKWEIKIINPLEGSCSGIDPILIVSKILNIQTKGAKFYNAENFFSYLLKHDHRFMVNMLIRFGRRYVARNAGLIQQGITQTIEREKPDILFSNIPLINGAGSRSAGLKRIPYIITPGDMKSNYYGHDISSPEDSGFRCALAFAQWSLLDGSDWMKINLRPGQLTAVGFPLRPEFYKEKSLEEVNEVLKDYQLPTDKKIVTLMMGAQGSKTILEYLHRLVKPSCPPMHILVLCGYNKDMITQIQKVFKDNLQFSAITIQPIGFTQNIADILRRSDLYITKTGGNSVAEAWALSRNTLFDPPGISGEVLSVKVSEEMGFGKVIYPFEDLGNIIKEVFSKKEAEINLFQERVRYAFQRFPVNLLKGVHHVLAK